MILSDVAAERAILAGICRYGEAAYYSVVDYVRDSTFQEEINQVIFKCLKHLFDNNDNIQIDVPTMFSAAQDLGLEHFFAKTNDAQHLQAILALPVELSNVRRHAGKIRKLEIANLLHQQLGEARGKLLDVTGNESITQIVGIAEDTIFNFASLLDEEVELAPIGDGLYDRIKYLADNPVEQIGISTGFGRYDAAIGGGLRNGTISLIGARTKQGKSILLNNMIYHITHKLNIPVLNLDTEMVSSDIEMRTLALMTKVPINDIETGRFANMPESSEKIYDAVKILKTIPYTHKNIVGKQLDEQLAIARRWITKHVGVNDDGTAKPCVIIYDYLQLMDAEDMGGKMQEYQALGFMIKNLHTFAVRHNLPILASIQLNRDGVNVEGTQVVSGSDRIAHTCSNLTIFKNKSDEEMAECGLSEGNKKLIPIICRHGPGLQDHDYINCHMKGYCAHVTEGKTRFELQQNNTTTHGTTDF